MAKYGLESFPLPGWLQWHMEQNIGRQPVWAFPHIPDSPEGLSFEKLHFHNRDIVQEMFEKDPDPWVDQRFKDPRQLYEYVAHLRIVMPYSGKRGGCDWLVRKEEEYVGLLHAFAFSRENFGFNHRKCAIGYVFAENARGSGLPLNAVRYFQEFLFKKMDRLYLTASVARDNHRSIRFLEKLGYKEWVWKGDEPPAESKKERHFELFRSRKARAMVHKYWNEVL